MTLQIMESSLLSTFAISPRRTLPVFFLSASLLFLYSFFFVFQVLSFFSSTSFLFCPHIFFSVYIPYSFSFSTSLLPSPHPFFFLYPSFVLFLCILFLLHTSSSFSTCLLLLPISPSSFSIYLLPYSHLLFFFIQVLYISTPSLLLYIYQLRMKTIFLVG